MTVVSIGRRGEVEKTMAHYEQHHKEMKNSHNDEDQSFDDNDKHDDPENEYVSFRGNDGCFYQHTANMGYQRAWPMDCINFNQTQHPQSMLFDEEQDYYETDDKYY